MTNPTFRASEVFSLLNYSLPWSTPRRQNAVVEHITNYFADNEYGSIDSLVRDLELAHWSAGSFGLIYYPEQVAFLNVASNRDDVEEVFEDLLDNMGEPIAIREFSDMLITALDHACSSIASLITHADLSIVINAADYLDPKPEVIITGEPDETVAGIIQQRLDMEVQHSTTTVNEYDLAAMEETLRELVRAA